MTPTAKNPASQKYALKRNIVQSNVEAVNYLKASKALSGRYQVLTGEFPSKI